VYRNRTLSSRYIGNVYCAQNENTFHTVHQKYVLYTETEHFPVGISQMCTVHRNRTFSRLYIRNVYSAQKQNTFNALHRKFVPCTKRENFPNGISEIRTDHRNRILPGRTSEMCTVHRNITLSRRYIRNAYCAQKQNSFHTVHQKCVLCTETEPSPDGT